MLKYNANLKNPNVKKKPNKQSMPIIYYTQKLSLFGRDDTRQPKSLIFIVFPQAE